MSLKCRLGRHTWAGCKCTTCGKPRDEYHNWSEDCGKCSICGEARDKAHSGEGHRCGRCGKTSDNGSRQDGSDEAAEYPRDYVESCMRPQYTEQPEQRSWNSDPTFKNVLNPLNAGDNRAAARQAEELVLKFPDFAGIYKWWATALMRSGAFAQARQVIAAGLAKSHEKYSLCVLAGEIEWRAGDLDRAVFWWSQGCHCQESLTSSHYGDSVGAYFYLYYVAEALRLSDCSRAFLQRVDAIDRGIRLSAPTASELMNWVWARKNRDVELAIRELTAKYFP
jgi:hypothetical protein